MADDAQQLDRQHRQHAGHEVENQPAEQGKQQDQGDRRRSAWIKAASISGDDVEPLFGAAVAVDQGHGQGFAGQRLIRPWQVFGTEHLDLQGGGAAIRAEAHGGF